MRAPSQDPMQSPMQGPIKVGAVDVEAFSRNLARLVEEGGKALAAYLKPREDGHGNREMADEMNEVVKTLGQVAQYWLADPQRTLELQTRLGKAYLDLWASAAKRLAGEPRRRSSCPRRQRQALRRSGMDVEPVLRFPQAGLSAQRRASPTSWSATPTTSTRTPGRRPSSTCGRSPTRSRRRTSF